MDSSAIKNDLQTLQETIFDIKDKISSQQFLTLMNTANSLFKHNEPPPPLHEYDEIDSDLEDPNDSDDDVILELSEDMRISIAGVYYYKISLYNLHNVILSYPHGNNVVGQLHHDNTTILPLDIDFDDVLEPLPQQEYAQRHALAISRDAVLQQLRLLFNSRETQQLYTPPIVPDPAWRDHLRIGSLIDVRDPFGNWFEAVVQHVFPPSSPSAGKIKIHFRSWSTAFDEYLPLDSIRIAPPFTFVNNWRKNISTGHTIEAKMPHTNKWFFAVVNSIDTTLLGTPDNPFIQISLFLNTKSFRTFRFHIASYDLIAPLYTHNKINPSFLFSPIPLHLFYDGQEGQTNSHIIVNFILNRWKQTTLPSSSSFTSHKKHPEFIYRLSTDPSYKWKGWNAFLKNITPLKQPHIDLNNIRDRYEKIAFDKLNL